MRSFWREELKIKEMILKANLGKKLNIKVNDAFYGRYPLKTHLITEKDDIVKVVKKYLHGLTQKGDVVFLSERVVAITQGRAIPIKDIKPSKLANFLVRFVYKPSYGIGIGSPWTMEMAIKEAGILRILIGSIISMFTKPLGLRGLFYKVVGQQVAAIDGPTSYTMPPYNKCATLGPLAPDKVALKISKAIAGREVIIIDANDIGVAVLGKTNGVNKQWAEAVFADNPLGQSREGTPLAIVRKIKNPRQKLRPPATHNA